MKISKFWAGVLWEFFLGSFGGVEIISTSASCAKLALHNVNSSIAQALKFIVTVGLCTVMRLVGTGPFPSIAEVTFRRLAGAPPALVCRDDRDATSPTRDHPALL